MNNNNAFKNIFPIAVTSILAILKPAGLAIIFAIPYLLIERIINKTSYEEIGFKIKNTWNDLKCYWPLIIAPTIIGIVSLFIAGMILPEFYMHILERIKPILSFNKALAIIPLQLFVLAYGEEITFRAFLQVKFCNIVSPVWAIIFTSVIFALAHYSMGSHLAIIYDLIFIFIDSVLYGFLYHKTQNVYVCLISHFLANLTGIYILLAI
jgi:membrane protease YdiL (CAAX protease family)